MSSFRVFILIIFIGLSAQAMDADFAGYLRGGTGLNMQGGEQECFFNQGIPGNFLRLGNECGFYSELIFIFNHVKPTADDPMFFRTQMRLMFDSKGTRQWEPAANRDISQIEAFVTAGGIAEIPGTIWVGKRFYRDVDVYIFDWYYYAEMSGVGAGIEDVPLGPGKFALAHLIQGNDDLTTNTSVGKPVLQAVDARWKSVPVGAEQSLNLWAVYAWAPRSSDPNGNQYSKTNGYSLSERLQGRVGSGDNNFTIMYGQGAMKDLNIYGSSAVPANNDIQNRAWTWRFVEDWHRDVSDKWAVMVAAAAENSVNGDTVNNRKQWQEIGVRPIYFVTDRFQWVFEGGASRIKDESELVNGTQVGWRNMTRVSIAPQLSINKSMWGRPVMRAFLTHTFWNDANKADIGMNAPTFANHNEGTTFGYQFEAWF